jgi:hypothetical protein
MHSALRRTLVIAILSLLFSVPVAAEGCTATGCTFELRGPISFETVATIKAKLAARPVGKPVLIFVDSKGGDVEAAMSLGRAIRAAAPVSIFVFQADCHSACVLAIAGATTRQLRAGRIGIHRPYSVGVPAASFAQNAKNFKDLEDRIRSYLNEMNLPPGLLDEMLRYEPQTLHVMTPEEISRFRLDGTDYIWRDQLDSEAAQRYGIDKSTYLARRTKADRTCTQSLDTPASAQLWIDCREGILRGR